MMKKANKKGFESLKFKIKNKIKKNNYFNKIK